MDNQFPDDRQSPNQNNDLFNKQKGDNIYKDTFQKDNQSNNLNFENTQNAFQNNSQYDEKQDQNNGGYYRNQYGNSYQNGQYQQFYGQNRQPNGQFYGYNTPYPVFSNNYQTTPEYYENKKFLRRFFGFVSGGVGLSVLLMQILSVLLMFVFMGLGIIIDTDNLQNGFGGMSAFGYYMYFILLYIISLFLPFAIMAFSGILKVDYKKAIPFNRPKINMLPFIFLGFGVFAVSNIANGIFIGTIESFGIPVDIPEMPTPDTLMGQLAYVFSISLCPALIEEFIFRGVILQPLRKYGDIFAITSSAVLFSLFHCTMLQLVFAFLLGFFLAYITIKTESIWPAIILHFVNNAMSGIIDIFTANMSEQNKIEINLCYFLFLGMFCVIGIIIICFSRKSNKFRLPQKQFFDSMNYRLNAVFLNAGSLILAIIWLLIAIGLPMLVA